MSLTLINNQVIALSTITSDRLVDGAKFESTYTTVWSKSADWDAAFGSAGADVAVRALTANYDSAYSTVKSNSATNWNYQGTDLKGLSSDWQSTYTTVWSKSADWDAAFGSAGADVAVRALTANYDSAYSTVKSNSATNWNYQGTDLKGLSSDWQSTYTTVWSKSADWGTGSGTTVGAYLPLSGGTVTGSVTVTGTVFAESFVLTTPGLIVFDTVSAAAISVTTLPIIGNDVELYSTTAVTITAFQNGIKGTLYTLTNKGTGTVTITASPTNFVRNGQSWSNRYIELSTNYACSLRADINNVVSIW